MTRLFCYRLLLISSNRKFLMHALNTSHLIEKIFTLVAHIHTQIHHFRCEKKKKEEKKHKLKLGMETNFVFQQANVQPGDEQNNNSNQTKLLISLKFEFLQENKMLLSIHFGREKNNTKSIEFSLFVIILFDIEFRNN